MNGVNNQLLITNYWPLIVGAAAGIGAAIIGAMLGLTGLLITIIAIAALAVGLWALADMDVGMWAIVAIIALLPFGALPFKVVLTPTFLDLAMGGVLFVYVMQW